MQVRGTIDFQQGVPFRLAAVFRNQDVDSLAQVRFQNTGAAKMLEAALSLIDGLRIAVTARVAKGQTAEQNIDVAIGWFLLPAFLGSDGAEEIACVEAELGKATLTREQIVER